MSLLKIGIVGMGFIGAAHIEAVRRIGFAEIAAVADTSFELAQKRAREYHIPRCCASIDELLSDPEIRIVHNCTPNYLHNEVNLQIMAAGKHPFSEKPLARTSAEGRLLLEEAKKYPDLYNAVNFNYRMNPLVQEMRAKIRSGEVGVPWLVHSVYLQDWLCCDTDYNWRIEPEFCGPSRCIADIGSHWMDIIQHILGSRIIEVCADIGRVFETRKKPLKQTETFVAAGGGDYEEVPVRTEDFGSVLFHMENGVHGVFHTSEVSAGHGCGLELEINCSKASMRWDQESPNLLWMGFRDRDNVLMTRNPASLSPEARAYTGLAKGHPEGWNDAFRSSILSFYRYVESDGTTTQDFATFEEAAYILRLTEAILKSSEIRRWVDVPEV